VSHKYVLPSESSLNIEEQYARDKAAWEKANRERENHPTATSISSSLDTDPAQTRLAGSGLNPGGVANYNFYNPFGLSVQFVNQNQPSKSKDWKVRISVSPNLLWFNSGIMLPLADHRGVIFPYTPEIVVQHIVNYASIRLTHSNYPYQAYENSEISPITITGDFTAQTKREADYVLACIYFFRSVTKMFFGQDTYPVKAGNPPPLVYLNGYGEKIFKNTPCVVTQFQYTMPSEVDYIETTSTGQAESAEAKQSLASDSIGISTRIPTVTKLSVTLIPVYSKRNISEFNLEEFALGRLIDKGFI
jgi:hypothetical protein